MNIAFIGGGSLRILPIVRSLLDIHRKAFEGGSIRLIDLKLDRAEAVGRMIMRCPEFKNTNCEVLWTAELEKGLEGADILYVTMAIERQPSLIMAERLSEKYDALCSDQLSLNGGFLAARGGPAILSFARKMEQCCPQALMLIFANPVAVYSAMVNNHSKIRALGICEGFHNHKWDLPRLCGRDEHDDAIDVVAAGVNHLSFILRGSWRGRDVFDVLREHITADWRPPQIDHVFGNVIAQGLTLLAKFHRRFGQMIFSSEGDGMAHIFKEETAGWFRRTLEANAGKSLETIAAESAAAADSRFDAFAAESRRDDDSVWRKPYRENPLYGVNAHDVVNPVIAAMTGGEKFRIVASAANRGAVDGFTGRMALEYTMDIQGREITAVENQYVPSPFYGLIASLSEFQTLLGDAIAARDPKLFADALEAYPVDRFGKRRGAYLAELFDVYTDIPAPLRQAKELVARW